MGREKLVQELLMKQLLSVKENKIQLFNKISYTMYPCRAIAMFIQDVGEKTDEKFIFELGYSMGEEAIKEIIENINTVGKFLPQKILNIVQLIEMSGFGQVDLLEDTKKTKRIQIKNHPVIEPSIKLYGQKSFSCDFFRGIYSAFFKEWFKLKKVEFKKKVCTCKGDKDCIFEAKNVV